MTFRDANLSDVDPLVELIESAYRGDASRAGWTTEADLLAGQRTDPGGVREVITAAGSRLLVAEQADQPDPPERPGGIVACCQLQKREAYVYFGMFSVAPQLQGAGVGKAVIVEAEQIAREWGAEEIRMTVIRQREDLIAFYERRGFRRTGRFDPFPYGDERFGLPLRDDLEFAELAKDL
nr:GNAT family N-acetyltransferase [Nocardioides panzhihuensis]